MTGGRIPLTGRQRVVFEYIRDYIAENSVAPTFDEMSKHFGRTLGTLHEIVAQLERRGWIRRDGEHKSQRNIAIVPDTDVARGVANALDGEAATVAAYAESQSANAAEYQEAVRVFLRRLASDLRAHARTLRT